MPLHYTEFDRTKGAGVRELAARRAGVHVGDVGYAGILWIHERVLL